MASSAQSSWERVLASLEAGVEQAERLLDVDSPSPVPPPVEGQANLSIRPNGSSLPERLRPRAEAIRRRQDEAAAALLAAMRAIRQQQALLESPAESRRPVYVDRRA